MIYLCRTRTSHGDCGHKSSALVARNIGINAVMTVAWEPVCGTHANVERREGRKVVPMADATPEMVEAIWQPKWYAA